MYCYPKMSCFNKKWTLLFSLLRFCQDPVTLRTYYRRRHPAAGCRWLRCRKSIRPRTRQLSTDNRCDARTSYILSQPAADRALRLPTNIQECYPSTEGTMHHWFLSHKNSYPTDEKFISESLTKYQSTCILCPSDTATDL